MSGAKLTAGALDLDGLELGIIDDEILAFGDLVAAALVQRRQRFTGFFIDELLAQGIAKPRGGRRRWRDVERGRAVAMVSSMWPQPISLDPLAISAMLLETVRARMPADSTGRELHVPGAAAQTRTVSGGHF